MADSQIQGTSVSAHAIAARRQPVRWNPASPLCAQASQPIACTLAWRANVERGAARFLDIHRGGRTGHAKANREIAPSTGETTVRTDAYRTTPLRARRATDGPLSRIPSQLSCLSQRLGRAAAAKRRPPASPLDAQAPPPQALSGLCRSSFRETEAARLASVQPGPPGLRPALCAPSGVNPHSQFLELGPPPSGTCVERRAAGLFCHAAAMTRQSPVSRGHTRQKIDAANDICR